LLCLPAIAQTQFSGQITSNVNGASATLANPVYYNETITVVGVSPSPPNVLSFLSKSLVNLVLWLLLIKLVTGHSGSPSMIPLGPKVTSSNADSAPFKVLNA
jgi:hypothetical protein